jgi:hypothetical protein
MPSKNKVAFLSLSRRFPFLHKAFGLDDPVLSDLESMRMREEGAEMSERL